MKRKKNCILYGYIYSCRTAASLYLLSARVSTVVPFAICIRQLSRSCSLCALSSVRKRLAAICMA